MASNEYQTRCAEVAALLPEYLRSAIPFEKFNLIQTNCLETWNTDSNVIINAPTGTGKTVCFELSILRHVHKTLRTADIKRLSSNSLIGKIVYIAPTKSICSERQAEWQQRFSFLGMNVSLATGDSASPDLEKKLSHADLIIATAEMWDRATRRKTYGSGSDFCRQVALLLLDEVHHIGDERGAVLESVVTRMLVSNSNVSVTPNEIGNCDPIMSLRIIAASATVGNIRDLGCWLGVPVDCIKCFDESFRPVPLEYHVLGYAARNPWLYTRIYEKQILKVLRQYGEGKPAIVFCTSKSQTNIYAQALLGQICGQVLGINHDENILTKILTRDQRDKLKSCASRCGDKLLETLLPHGVAVHNADISLECRRVVEELFRESLIMCLFSTSTLAQGVNLPARLVVIAGTTIYCEGQLQEYNRNKLLQMCGRAGRIGLDNHGVAVIMTARSNLHLYQNISSETAEVLESRLEADLENVINAEVARHTITDIPTAIHFIKRSFLWTRMLGRLSSEGESTNPGGRAAYIASDSIRKLADMNLIRYDEDLYGVETTLAGAYMAEYCVSFKSMRVLGETLPKAKRPSHVLRAISSCSEILDGVLLRRSERKRLNELNQSIRMPIPRKVSDPIDKVFILLQVAISERPGVDMSFRNESNRLLKAVSRVCRCIIDLLLSQALRAPYHSLTMALQVSRALLNKCSWSGSTILRQVHGVTVSHCQTFWKNGIRSIANLATLDSRGVAEILDGSIRLAVNVRQRLRQIPKFTVEVEDTESPHGDLRTEMKSISINVDVASQLGNELRGNKKLQGFILVASDDHDIWLSERFEMNDCLRKIFVCGITESPNTDATCINVLIGCDSIIGVDWSGRYFYDHKKKLLTNRDVEKQERDHMKKNPSGHTLSVTTGRVSKRTLCVEDNSRTQVLKHSFLSSLMKKQTAVPHPYGTNETTGEESNQSPYEIIVPTKSAEAQRKDQGMEPVLSLFGTRCEGVALPIPKTSLNSLHRPTLDDSVERQAREYDDMLRSLY